MLMHTRMGEIGEKMLISGNELGLDVLGLTELDQIHRNLSIDDLIEETVANNEGIVGANGASTVSYTHLTLPTKA